jgi:ATP-dependent Clp protease protease subunit
MKLVFGLVAAFAVFVTGTVYFSRPGDTSSKTPSETVQISNNTVNGNITEDLKSKDDSSLVQAKKSVIKLSAPKSRVVYFYSDFNQQSVKEAVSKLKELEAKSNDRILLLINSPGGSVIDGAELISQMESSKAPVDTVCMKLCASMAAMTHSYGAKRYSLDRAILMYHPASGSASGQVPNMLSLLKTITRYVDKMNANVVNRSKISKTEFESLVAYELWIDSEDALSKGFIDGIVNINVDHEPEELDEEEPEYEDNNRLQDKKIEFQWISPYAKELW